MPYDKWSEVNKAVQGIEPKVTLSQANLIAKWADAAEDGLESPWAAAIAQFKKLYKSDGDKWMKKVKANVLQFASNQVAEVRREEVGGIEYLVAPVVAICEGVLNSELVPAEEIGNHFHSWDGRPVVLGHPKEGDIDISANDPEILNEIGIGWLYNTEFVDGKLKGEMWHPVAALERIAPEYKERLEAGEETEVSTAYFRDRKEQPGKFGDVEYGAVAMNLHPDHLAILLDVEGACNWQDGCGAPRVNVQTNKIGGVWNALTTIAGAFGINLQSENTQEVKPMEDLIAKIVEDERLDLSEEQLADSSEEVLTAIVGLLDKPEQELETQDEGGEQDGDGEVQTNEETLCTQELPPELMALVKAVEDRGGPDKVFSLLDGISANQDAHKNGLIEALAINSACAFSKEQLFRMDVDTLETLQQSLAPADYSGRGGGPALNVKDITPLVMPDIFAKQEQEAN
jgi:hypothetical protein